MEPDGSAGDLCQLCHGVRAAYTCPRCNTRYCSVGCYRAEAHSACSEAFYRDCCLERLRDHRTPGPDQKLLRVLQNLEKSGDESWDPGELNGREDDAEQEEQTLEQRMEGLDLDRDGDRVWERLTEREKREFDELLSRGEIHRLIPPWVPWWDRTVEPHHPGLVEELDPSSGVPPAQLKPAVVPVEELDPSSGLPPAQLKPAVVPVEELDPSSGLPPARLKPAVVPVEELNPSSGLPPAQLKPAVVPVKELDPSSGVPPARLKPAVVPVEELNPSSGLLPAQLKPTVVPVDDDPPPPLSELLSKPPSPTVGPALASVLFAYALTARNYAGNLDSDAALAMLAASPALGRGVVYQSTALALQDALRLARERGESRGLCLLALHDSARLLDHAQWSCAALADAARALNAARRVLLQSSARSCFLAKKKIDFLRSWIAAESGSLASLAAEAQLEYEESSTATKHLDEDRKRLEEAWGGPRPPRQPGPLIQEL